MNTTTGLELVRLYTKGLPLILNFTAVSFADYGTQISATECGLYFRVGNPAKRRILTIMHVSLSPI